MRVDIHQSVGRAGRNRPPDVDTVLHLINLHRRRTGLTPLSQRRKVDDEFVAAIEEYQRNSLRQRPTGTIEPGKTDMACLRLPLGTYVAKDYTDPPWLKIACDEKRKNIRELPGLNANNPEILKYIATFPGLARIEYAAKSANGATSGHKMSEVDETAWCACFVNWCLCQAGKKQGPSAQAKSWLTYGQQT
ncbi:MAG TPA: hypothetical protein VJR89_31125, partial [Polyangiales bacterium]|nr:hypothetical protein [Polyangiales bacterium]